MRLILFAVALALGTFSAARAADDPVPRKRPICPASSCFTISGAPGMVLVIERGGATLMRFYGETEKGNHRLPDGTSLLRLNSITKVFTTEMVAVLAAENKLALTDPLQRFAGDVKVPRFGERPITLLDLATHSAALPREMGALPEGANPRAWPTLTERWKWLPSYMLPWAPGRIAAYSNVGFDLLADAAAQAGGKSYAELLRTHVTGPLGMVDTGFRQRRSNARG